MPVQTLARSPREALDGKAGLLASGSSYSRSFPHGQPSLLEDPLVQWLFRFRTRLQWRGPRRIHTGFPFSDGWASSIGGRAVTAPSVLSKKAYGYWLGPPPGSGDGAGAGAAGTGNGTGSCGSGACMLGSMPPPTSLAGIPAVSSVLTNCGMV
jgi:hypothetical protein